jgi:4-carboxymuconolactone decarboxylase
MGSSALRLWLVLAVVAAVPALTIGQSRVDPPGSQQPRPPAKPRIAPLPESQWTAEHKKLVEQFSRDGRADNGLRTLLHLPPLVDAIMPYTVYLTEESSLRPRHRDLLVLRAAWLAGSQAVWSRFAPRARTNGMTAAEIRRVAEGPDAGGWSAEESTLLRMVDQLYRNSSVTDATWKALASGYDLFNLIDAVETANHFIVVSMVYNSFGVQPDEGTPDRLPADVAYRVTVPPREPPLAMARIEPAPGDGIAVGRTFGRHPKLNAPRARRANFINRVSKLSPKHREMLILRIGWNCQAEYEWAQHVGSVGRARDHGLEPVRIAEGPDAQGWDPFERNILRAVDELYREALVSDRTWAALAERYDTGLMMSAVFTPSSYRATSMSLNAYGVQLEPGNERFPKVGGR